MSNTGKTIKQYGLLASLNNDDAVMIQRGNTYQYVKAQSLGSGALIELVYADIVTLKSADTLEGGATYYITDKYIFVSAIDSDKFSASGVYYARNADYNGAGTYAGITIANGFTVNTTGTQLGIWTSALAPASGDVVIYNNLHWLNITGANGASNPPADAVNWEAVVNTGILVANTYGYIYEFDAIEYDFDNDTITRRVDLRSNDIAENSIATWQWGDDGIEKNTVFGEATATTLNNLGSIKACNLFGDTAFNLASGNSVTGLTVPWYTTSTTASIIAYDGTSSIRGMLLAHVNRLDIYIISALLTGTVDARTSDIEYSVHLTATAYNAGTTYTFGDFMTVASVTYMYRNSVDASGNAAPNATYWQEVFDVSGGAGTHKLTISKYFNCAGTFNLISTAATETIDEVVYSTFPSNLEAKFTCETGLAVTFDNTAYASLAAAGEILASANVVVDGDKAEFAVFLKATSTIGGISHVMRELYSQTAYA